MVTFDLPRHSMAFYTVLGLALFYLGNAMPDTTVHVKVAPLTPTLEDGSLPDQLSLVIQDDSGWETDLVLNRAEYIKPNIPVYTYCGACKEGSKYQLAELEDSQNVAYYQSADNRADIQVTQVDSSEHQFNFLLDGELVVDGTRCSLNHEFKRKRDAALSSPFSSDDVIYTLHEIPPIPIVDDVLDDLASQLKHGRSLQRPITEVSGSSDMGSSPVLSRASRNSKSIFIDTVAVVDFAKYQQFQSLHGSEKKTLEAMKKHYLSVINGVSRMYQTVTSLPYRIEVLLVALYVDTDSFAPWSTNFYVSNTGKLSGQGFLRTFQQFTLGHGGDEFYPNDHIFFFTGCDLRSVNNDGSLKEFLYGITNFGNVCDRGSVSINRDGSRNQAITTATHELAHTLSAQHDSDVPQCSTGHWFMLNLAPQFSPCSIHAFNSYIQGKLATEEGQKCLWEKLPKRNVRSTFSRDIPDEEISHDDQ